MSSVPQIKTELMSERDVAEYLGMSISWVQKRRLYGNGPKYRKLHGRIKYRRSDLDAYIEQCERTSTSQAPSKNGGRHV